MKLDVLFILGLLVFASCERSDETTKPLPDPPEYFPLTTGSFWVYDTYRIDSMGNETLECLNDTIRVLGDTLIDSDAYKIVRGKRVPLASSIADKFYRDSAGFILDPEHAVIFPAIDFNDSITEFPVNPWEDESVIYWWYKKLETCPENISISSLLYDSVLNWKLTIVKSDEIDESMGAMNNYFAPNVGRIMYQFTYLMAYEIHRYYYEARLVDYYIAPHTRTE